MRRFYLAILLGLAISSNAQRFSFEGGLTYSNDVMLGAGVTVYGFHFSASSNMVGTGSHYMEYNDGNSAFTGDYNITTVSFGYTFTFGDVLLRPCYVYDSRSEVWENYTLMTTTFLVNQDDRHGASIGIGYYFHDDIYFMVDINTMGYAGIKIGFSLLR